MSKSKRSEVWTIVIGSIGANGIPLSAQAEALIEEVIVTGSPGGEPQAHY